MIDDTNKEVASRKAIESEIRYRSAGATSLNEDQIPQPFTWGFNADKTEVNIMLRENFYLSHVYEEDVSGWILKTDGSAEFNDITIRGTIYATLGEIGGWVIDSDKLYSAEVGAKVELDAANNRVSVWDATNEKVVMGYLDGLPKYDLSGNWGMNDYGFWVRRGDNLVIDGDATYENGDWLIDNDASFQIVDALDAVIMRLGTFDFEKGLFINEANTGTDFRGRFTASSLFIGNDDSYLEWTVSGLSLSGTITAADGEIGGWTIGPNSLSAGNMAINDDGSIITPFVTIGTDGKITATEANFSGAITATSGSLGTLDVTGDITIGAGGSIIAGATTLNNTGIDAQQGTIGGWVIDSTKIASSDDGLRADPTNKRFEVRAGGLVKGAFGYLNGIEAYDANDYGLYLAPGNQARIEGGGEFVNADYLIEQDGAFVINGSDTLEKGRFGSLGLGVVGLKIGDIDPDAGTGDGIYVDETGKAVFSGELTVGSMPILKDDGLVAHWSLDDASGLIAADNSGNKNDGTLVGFGPVAEYHFEGDATDETGNYDGTPTDITYVTGKAGQAASFNGTSSYIDLPNITWPSNTFTLSFWKNNEIQLSNLRNCVLDLNGSVRMIFANQIDNIARFAVYSVNGWHYFSADHYPPSAELSLIQIVIEETTASLYIDNEFKQTISITEVTLAGSATAMRIGSYTATPHHFLIGPLDDLRIYDYALSAAERTALYNRPQEPSHWVDGVSGRALAFDGVSPSVQLGDVLNITGSQVAVSMWYFMAEQPPDTSTRGIIGRTETFASAQYGFQYQLNGQQLRVYLNNIHPIAFSNYFDNYGNQWTHCVMVFDRPNVYLYLNGELVSQAVYDADIDSTEIPFTIGKSSGVSSNYRHIIDEPRIYNRALSADEIKYLYWNPAGGGNRTTINGGQITTGAIKSTDFVAGESGWNIDLNGDVEFNDGTFRGDLLIGSDNSNRQLSIGSDGLYVEDSADNKIHDLPNAPLTTSFNYLGHFYYLKTTTDLYTSSVYDWPVVNGLSGGFAVSYTWSVSVSPNLASNTNLTAIGISLNSHIDRVSGGSHPVKLTVDIKVSGVIVSSYEIYGTNVPKTRTSPVEYDNYAILTNIPMLLDGNSLSLDVTLFVKGTYSSLPADLLGNASFVLRQTGIYV